MCVCEREGGREGGSGREGGREWEGGREGVGGWTSEKGSMYNRCQWPTNSQETGHTTAILPVSKSTHQHTQSYNLTK